MNISVKNGSSIWKLATLWGDEMLPTNFCSLFWCVVWRLFFISMGCILTGAYLGFLTASIAASISVGYVIWSTPILITSGLITIVSCIFLFVFTHYKATESMDNNPKGLMSNTVNAYSSWKNKYCPKITELG